MALDATRTRVLSAVGTSSGSLEHEAAELSTHYW